MQFFNIGGERARITAGGGFSVGTTTDLGAGNIAIAAGKYLGYSSTAYMTPEDNSIGARVSTPGAFTVWTGATPAERARITADGDLYVGGSVNSYNSRVHLFSNASGNNIIESHQITGSNAPHCIFINSNGAVGSIYTNGSATSFNTSSDRRLKENIAPADDAGSVIDAIAVVKHDWKVGGHTRYGMIAQDLHQVAPEAVSVGDDGDEVKSPWGVDYSKLVPMLVKEIQSLRARVAQLESK